MSMGDRIAVMNAGQIQQIASPSEIYHDPNSLFVADFIGSPEINFFEGSYRDGVVATDAFEVDVPDAVGDELASGLDDDDVVLGIRPEDIEVVDPGQGLLDTEIQVVEPMGDTQILYFDVAGSRIRAVMPSMMTVQEGDTVALDVNWPNVHFFRPDGPKVLKWRHVAGEDAEMDVSAGEQSTEGV